jgi:hypothetical protein
MILAASLQAHALLKLMTRGVRDFALSEVAVTLVTSLANFSLLQSGLVIFIEVAL